MVEVELDLRDAASLKEKRRVLSSLKAGLRQRFVAAVAETAAQDDRRRGVLVCALVGGPEVRDRTAELRGFVDARCPDRCSFRCNLVTLADLRC